MKERILHNWNGTRVFQSLAGLAICIGSIAEKEWSGLIPGGYFLVMGVFALGCAGNGSCYGGSCSAPTKRSQRSGPDHGNQ